MASGPKNFCAQSLYIPPPPSKILATPLNMPEYVALSSAMQESIWLRQLTTELGSPTNTPTLIFEDNQSAITMTNNPTFSGCAKHIDIHTLRLLS